ncbi:MAG: peptidylprolyl isomerase [Pseudomonadota bacterium]
MIDTPVVEESLKTPSAIVAEAPSDAWVTVDPDQLMLIDTAAGRVTVMLSDTMAQAHVEQMKTLVSQRYYDGLSFYRVIDGFVAQGGVLEEERDLGAAAAKLAPEFDETLPKGAQFAGLGYKDGFAPEAGFIGGMPAGRDPETGKAWLAHCTGAFAFGREDAADSASSEIYITLQPQRYLDRNLTVAGRVIDGMDAVQRFPRGDREVNIGIIAKPENRAKIIRVRMASDLPEVSRPHYQVFDTNTDLFTMYVKSHANRPSGFFYFQPDHADLCQVPIPVREVETAE